MKKNQISAIKKKIYQLMTDLNSGNPKQLCGLQIIGKLAEQKGNINNYFGRSKKKGKHA